MNAFLRKVRIGLGVFLTVVVGGGFATAAGNDPDLVSHSVTYSVLSFRAISLSSADPVPIGAVRQGSFKQVDGPDIYYATTWAGDQITVGLSADMETDLQLYLIPGTPAVNDSYTPAETTTEFPVPCDTDGEGVAASSVLLDSTDTTLVNSITDCGLDTAGAWITLSTAFKLDATSANDVDTDYTNTTSKTVTYTIDQPA
ncbi:MAG: hypothetical protein ACKOA9_02105 [Actinomycetota bacterium]